MGGRRLSIGQPALRQALQRFVVWSILALVVVGVGAVVVGDSLAEDIALREASMRGGAFARIVAAPLVNEAVRRGAEPEVTTLATAMRNRLRDRSIVHVKVWSEGGRVLWADDPALIGRTFPMEPTAASLFGTLGVRAELSDLDKEENAGERADGPLLEVYAGTTDADGRPVVIESYWSTARIQADEFAILVRFVPLSLGALLIFACSVLPIAVTLARRVDRAQAERSAMLRHALSASDLERRRIARELHDGLIQDLAGLGYALPSVAAELPPEARAARQVLDAVSSGLQVDISSLRGMVTDLYPSDLSREGLLAAIDELADRARETGLHVEVIVVEAFSEVSSEVAHLTYQVLREGLRNVAKHAHAVNATLVASVTGSEAVVTVTDDGIGVDGLSAQEGHLGLRLLSDTVRDVGGVLTVRTLRSGGTQLSARFPLSLAQA